MFKDKKTNPVLVCTRPNFFESKYKTFIRGFLDSLETLVLIPPWSKQWRGRQFLILEVLAYSSSCPTTQLPYTWPLM